MQASAMKLAMVLGDMSMSSSRAKARDYRQHRAASPYPGSFLPNLARLRKGATSSDKPSATLVAPSLTSRACARGGDELCRCARKGAILVGLRVSSDRAQRANRSLARAGEG